MLRTTTTTRQSTTPAGPPTGAYAVVRGGVAGHARSNHAAARSSRDLDDDRHNIGIRIAAVIDHPKLSPSPAPEYKLEFDGDGDFVHIPSLKYDGSHPLTIEAWIAPRTPSSRLVFTGWGKHRISLQLLQRWTPGVILGDGKSRLEFTNAPIPRSEDIRAGVPTHIALVRTNDSLVLFVDGKKATTVDRQIPPSPSDYETGDGLSLGLALDGQNRRLNLTGLGPIQRDDGRDSRFTRSPLPRGLPTSASVYLR